LAIAWGGLIFGDQRLNDFNSHLVARFVHGVGEIFWKAVRVSPINPARMIGARKRQNDRALA